MIDAQPGFTARVDRVRVDMEGGELSRETISEDTYAAVAPAIYVGVQQRE